MRHLWLMWAAALGLLAALPAHAQQPALPRLELGGDVSAFIPIVSEDGPVVVPGAGPRVTTNLTPRLALEALAEIVGPLEFSGTMVVYQTRVKLGIHTARQEKRRLSFVLGAAGAASYQHSREVRIMRRDGSTVVYPTYRRFRASAPNTLAAGITHDRVLGRHASSHLSIQAYVGAIGGIGLRASAGVSFGIGGYR